MTLVLGHETAADADLRRIVVAAGDPGTRAGLVARLSAALAEPEIFEAGSLSALIGMLTGGEKPFDLVLLDLAMPGVGGLAGLLYLRSRVADLPFVATSSTTDVGSLRLCLEAGAAGFVAHTADAATFADVVGAALAGIAPRLAPAGDEGAETLRRLKSLTPQQLRVLTLLCPGLLNKQIAYELKVSEATVKAHVSAILQKLGVDGRAQAVEALSRINGGQPPCGLRAA